MDRVIQQLERELANAVFAATARRKNINKELRLKRQEIVMKVKQREEEILQDAARRAETATLAAEIQAINHIFFECFRSRCPEMANALRPAVQAGAVSVANAAGAGVPLAAGAGE